MNPVRGLLGAAVLIVLVAACSGGAAANVTPPPEADAFVTASSGSFEDHEVAVPAGRPFEFFFRNLDPATHNVAIYADDTASDPLFVGETITNAAITYEVPAFEPGAYFFRCDVHPEMTGTVVATG
jgi:plastocyanin